MILHRVAFFTIYPEFLVHTKIQNFIEFDQAVQFLEQKIIFQGVSPQKMTDQQFFNMSQHVISIRGTLQYTYF